MNSLWSDLIYGIRMLRKSPGVTAIVVVALAVGIGANTAIYSFLDALILRPFDFANQDRLVVIWEQNIAAGRVRGSVSPGDFSDWREPNQTFSSLIAVEQRSLTRTDGDRPERWTGYAATPDFFETLGVKAALGRTFQAGDEEPGRDPILVLKYSLWQREFGGDLEVVGSTVTLDGKRCTIAGVMGPDFNYPFQAGEFWTPLVLTSEQRADHRSRYLSVFGLLKPGVTVAEADADIKAIAVSLQQLYPQTNAGRSSWVLGMNADATRGSGAFVPVAMGAVAFLLLIACANVANIQLARAASRQKEIAVRLAIGASRWRILRQLLLESMILATLGGAAGLMLAIWSIEPLRTSIPEGFARFIPGWSHFGMNLNVLAFTVVAAMVTGLLFGLLPAWQSARMSYVDALKDAGKGSAAQSAPKRWRNLLVIAEVALSLVLLTGAGLMARSFAEVWRTDWGFNPENVLTMDIALAQAKYQDASQRIDFYGQLLQKVEALPGVQRAGTTSVLPFRFSSDPRNFEIVGRPFEQGRQPTIYLRVVSDGYFQAVGTPLRAGRLLDEQDNQRSAPVAVVDEAFVRRFMPGEQVLERRVKITGTGEAREIVGVVATVMSEDLDNEVQPTAYVPYGQAPWLSATLVIRTDGDPNRLAGAVRDEVTSMDSTQPVANIKALRDLVNERSAPKRVATWSMGVFAVLALLLAAVGIYAVMSYLVASRTHELGIRIALGAGRWDILRLIVGQGLFVAMIGLVIGLAGSLALTRLLAPMLYGIGTTDPITFAGVSLLFAMIAGLACYVPGHRAMKVDPMVALRYE